jgi:hypothetical protein
MRERGTIRTRRRSRFVRAGALALTGVWLALAPAAGASVSSCKLHLAQFGQRYVRDALRLLQRCELLISEGGLPPQDCRAEPATLAAITKTVSKIRERIRKKCAGITPQRIGYPSPECPGVATLDELTDCLIGFLNGRIDDIIAAELGCPGRCGDGVADVDCGEQCDGADVAGQTCTGLGFANGGTLLCTAQCTVYTGSCLP